ncbi:hypothetical protein [Enterovirga sp.]|uniref:hypothetical protein n=1 Tax=Enterovirga sp. TaxID=2026350 RepID=UPI002C8F2317|nr:hypothetical protein [Enterovirga sp.]HMO28481.1 hypothetical protein [Enterovirga sp.]
MRHVHLVLGLLALGAAGAGPAHALSMKECSAKYQEAKKAGGTLSWSDFRKAQCGTEASAAPGAAPASAPAAATPAPAAKSAAAPAAGSVSYPAAVDPKYAKETPGKARMHTCLDAYNAAKAAGTLGDVKWIQKGGGYYSACNAKLKG